MVATLTCIVFQVNGFYIVAILACIAVQVTGFYVNATLICIAVQVIGFYTVAILTSIPVSVNCFCMVTTLRFNWLVSKWWQLQFGRNMLLKIFKKHLSLQLFANRTRSGTSIWVILEFLENSAGVHLFKWNEVFKSGLSKFFKVCLPQKVLKDVFHKICLVYSGILCLICSMP